MNCPRKTGKLLAQISRKFNSVGHWVCASCAEDGKRPVGGSRSHLEGRIARVLFTVIEGQMVLLHAFIKKAQKTPRSELDTARARKAKL
ncbi:type II toxin-antitoxin system RelE/ParE family toxin [Desulfobacterium sp. N47]|uniref:type II toxin-antitoxin system RelE/ParE family toxin n=1 Tax=Desulfobacterium sp. N47 TaxID=3115210 RepID=UPI003F4A492B